MVRLALTFPLLIAGALAGCVPPTSDGTTQPATQPVELSAEAAAAQASADPRDARETATRVFRVYIYQFELPAGTISDNAAFWKPFDETFLSFDTHAALNKTGIRVGRAPFTEIGPLSEHLEGAEIKEGNLTGRGGTIEMEVGDEHDRQDLWWFDPNAAHFDARTFMRSQNLYVVAYRQLPRRPDEVHVDFAPAVRELSPVLNREPGATELWIRPTTIYALGISSELAADQCIVIAPSPVAVDNSLVLGRAFLMEEGPATRTERILLIVPRVLRLADEPQRVQPQ